MGSRVMEKEEYEKRVNVHDMLPFGQCLNNGKHFTVMYFVVAFNVVDGFGVKGDWVIEPALLL